MRQIFFLIVIIILGAAVLAPAIAFIGFDPVWGDFTLRQGNWHLAVPVTYSLCASAGLGLLYYFAKG